MGTIIARTVNLIAVGLLSGNELGSLLNVHPTFDDLDLPTRILAKQSITERHGMVMPFFHARATASFLPVLWLSRRQRPAPFLLNGGSMGCFVAVLATIGLVTPEAVSSHPFMLHAAKDHC